MEKKTKKLQLRKETIAVLNGERMSHVIGGIGYCEPPYEEVDGRCLIVTPSNHCFDADTKSDNMCTHQTLCNQATCELTICHKVTC